MIHSSGRGALNDAVNQALRGASGIFNTFLGRPAMLGSDGIVKVIPAVLTNARLLTCDTDLAEASFETGDLPQSAGVAERPWVWLRTNVSSHLNHRAEVFDRPGEAPARSFRDIADRDYARSVAMVTWSGLHQFLTMAGHLVGEH